MLHEEIRLSGMGAAVEYCQDDAWRTWKKQYAPNISHEAAWLDRVHLVHTEIDVQKAGRVRIKCIVQCRKPWESDTYWYSWGQVSPDELLLVTKS